MTKNQAKAFCLKQGWLPTYSGRTKTLYVATDTSHEEVELAILQASDYIPDFKIAKA